MSEKNEERVNDLIFICERMIEILNSENDSLKALQANNLKDRLDEKTQLSLFYERHMKAIKQNRNAFDGVETDLLDTLREVGNEMQELLEENGRLLKIAMEANRTVLKQAAEAAREHVPHSGNYSESATIGPNEGVSLAVSLNQEL